MSKYFWKTREAHHGWRFCQKRPGCGWSDSSSAGCGTATCTPLWQRAAQLRWHARCQDSAESAGVGDDSAGPGLDPGPTARSWNWWGGWTRRPRWQSPWCNRHTKEIRVKRLTYLLMTDLGECLASVCFCLSDCKHVDPGWPKTGGQSAYFSFGKQTWIHWLRR